MTPIDLMALIILSAIAGALMVLSWLHWVNTEHLLPGIVNLVRQCTGHKPVRFPTRHHLIVWLNSTFISEGVRTVWLREWIASLLSCNRCLSFHLAYLNATLLTLLGWVGTDSAWSVLLSCWFGATFGSCGLALLLYERVGLKTQSKN